MAIRLSSLTFVGRAAELGVLEAARRRAAAGPSVVVVGGEAGVGKTRLVDEFARRCQAEDVRVPPFDAVVFPLSALWPD